MSEGTRSQESIDEKWQSQPGTALSTELDKVMLDVMGDVGAPTLHNFKGSKLEIWKKIAEVTTAECDDFDSIGEDGVELHEFYVHSVEFVEEDGGEITRGVRCVLIPRVGTPFACVSDGIAKDLAGIIRTFGFGPYDPPIHVKPISIKTRRGFKTYRLMPVD